MYVYLDMRDTDRYALCNTLIVVKSKNKSMTNCVLNIGGGGAIGELIFNSGVGLYELCNETIGPTEYTSMLCL